MTTPLVLKLGGELLETAPDRARIASAIAAIAAARPVVVVHGGGRAVDAAMARLGLTPRKVDGMRVTDEATLEVVVSVLKGVANTDLVAALVAAGVNAVGLSGVDAGLGRATRTWHHPAADGSIADLGLVGDPQAPETTLIDVLLGNGYVPVVASLGLDDHAEVPQVLNVNADVMACRLAAALAPSDLAIAGTTAGVLDDAGGTIHELDFDALEAAVASGTATAGMIAKLRACRTALAEGVSTVRIIDGRALDTTRGTDLAPGTTIVVTRQAGRAEPQECRA